MLDLDGRVFVVWFSERKICVLGNSVEFWSRIYTKNSRLLLDDMAQFFSNRIIEFKTALGALSKTFVGIELY